MFLTEWAEEQRVTTSSVFRKFLALSARLPTTTSLRDFRLPPLFWEVTQRRFVVSYRSFGRTCLSHHQRSNRLVVPCRRLGTTYRSHHEGSNRLAVSCRRLGRTFSSRHQWWSSLTIEDGTDRLFPNVGNYLLTYAAWIPVRAKMLLLASSYYFKCNFYYRLRPNLFCSLCTNYCAILS